MKKVMLFAIALLFSVNASAASINVVNDDVFGSAAFLGTAFNDTSSVVSNAVATEGEFEVLYSAVTDVNTWAIVEWTFNPSTTLAWADLAFDSTVSGFVPFFETVSGAFATYVYLEALEIYFFDIIGESLGNLGVTMTVTAVPVPAALFLFVPALLGLFGLRRRVTSVA
ncbi:MAG: hypothetical protein COB23_06480 [Methylophaga sp.]|nr:MAG: hypothetical protein COB23_06480 [Methylophaga sp.]